MSGNDFSALAQRNGLHATGEAVRALADQAFEEVAQGGAATSDATSDAPETGWQVTGGRTPQKVRQRHPGGGVAGHPGATPSRSRTSALLAPVPLDAPEPPPEPVIADFAYLAEVTGLIAPGGIGKTFTAQILAVAALDGREVAGIECGPIDRVMIVDADQGRRQAVRRARQVGLHEYGERVRLYVPAGLDLLNPAHVAELRDAARDFDGDLIVLDSLRALTPGADESSSTDMLEAMQAVRSIAEAGNAAVVAIMHAGKDESRGQRGSSVIRDQASLTFALSAAPDKTLTLRCTKNRLDERPRDRHFKLEQQGLRMTLTRSAPATTFTRDKPAQDALEEPIFQALHRSPMRRAALARAIGKDPKDRTFRRVVEAMVAAGQIVCDNDVYSPPPNPDSPASEPGSPRPNPFLKYPNNS